MASLNTLNVSSATSTNVQSPQIITQNGNQQAQIDREKLLIYQWINELTNADTRENALLELSKKREVVTDLGNFIKLFFIYKNFN